ncbi:hypothetical protein AAHB94_01155 [Bacillus toyonensis]
MKKIFKIIITGLFATSLLVGCGSKEEPKKESTKQEAKQEIKKNSKYDEEKVRIAEKFHPVVYPHKPDGTIDKLSSSMTKKKRSIYMTM